LQNRKLAYTFQFSDAAWFESPLKPTILPSVLNGWTVLLREWIADESLPILVRSSKALLEA